MSVRIGLDIGGTKTAALVVGEDNAPLAEITRPTDVSHPDRLVAGVVATVDRAPAAAGMARHELAAAGVGVPGQVDPSSGTVRMAVNLNLHEPFPLRDALQNALGAPVTLENDVRAGTWGAFNWARETEAINNLAYLSVGTGIAAGLVLDGRLYRGAHGMAGEVGHVILDPAGPRCACGSYGCLEAFAAGPAIAAYAATVVPVSGGVLDAARVYALAVAGQPAAVHVVERTAAYLARAVYLLVMTYDVDKVVLGGGVTRAGAAFEQPLRAALAGLAADSPMAASMVPDAKVAVVPVGFNVGAIGAVYLTGSPLFQKPRFSEEARFLVPTPGPTP